MGQLRSSTVWLSFITLCAAGGCHAFDARATDRAPGAPDAAQETGSAGAPATPATPATPTESSAPTLLLSGEPFALSVPERHGGPPGVQWVDARWQVAWGSDGVADRAGGPWLERATLSAEGTLEARRRHPLAGSWAPEILLAADGGIGALHASSPCALDLYAFDADDGDGPASSVSVACGGDANEAAAAPIPGSQDWVIAYGAGEQGGEFVVGRYRPELGDWVTPPVNVAPRSDGQALDVFVAGTDALVVWGGIHERGVDRGAGLGIARDFASARVGPSAMTTLALSGDVLRADGWFGLSSLGGRSLLVGLDGRALWATPIDGGDVAPNARPLAATGVADRRPGVAVAEDAGVTVICYATGPGPAGGSGDHDDGISCVVTDAEGSARGEPLVIADGIDNIGGVDVAFSGEAFLVVYWDIEMGPLPAPTDMMRAQLLELR